MRQARPPARLRIPFRAVNRRGASDYDPGLQRHHLMPRQLLGERCFAALFDAVGLGRATLDDFRLNGLLLPAHDAAALRMGLPLHRGPHRRYNGMVIERVGQIEAGWAALRRRCADQARAHALMRLDLLQRALRRRLLSARRAPFALSSKDPQRQAVDFTDLDAMAASLWGATGSPD